MGENNNLRMLSQAESRRLVPIRRKLLRKRLWVFAVASVALSVNPTRADDLISLYNAAVISDPRYRAAEAKYHAVQQKLPLARANLMPRAEASAKRNRNQDETVTDRTIFSVPAGQAEYSSSVYSLSLNQPIFNTAALAGVRQAHAQIRQAEAEYAAARQELMLRLAETYFQTLLAHDTHALAAAEKEILEKHSEAAQARHDAGISGITELEDARARSHNATAQEIETSNRLDDQRQALREIAGHPPQAFATLAADMPLLLPDPPDIERWAKTSLSQNLSVRAAAEAAEAAREEIARNRNGHYPTLDLVGTRNRNDADASINGPGIRSDSTVIGLQLTLPLFQGGQVAARTQEAVSRYDGALQDLEALRRNTDRTARNAFQNVRGAQAKVEALKQAISAGETALAAKTQGYQAGLYHLIDVLDTTRELYRTQRDYAEARYTYVIALVRLKQAAGTLSEDDLAQINRWLR